MRTLFFVAIFISISIVARCQGPGPDTPRAVNIIRPSSHSGAAVIPGDDTATGFVYLLSQKEFLLSLLVIALFVFSLVIETILILKSKIPKEQAFKTIIITIIVLGSLFLITSGYQDSQVAPVFALLGTISGYLFARSERSSVPPGSDGPASKNSDVPA